MEKIKELAERQSQLDSALSRNPGVSNTPSKEQVFGAPTARKGESVMSSRGFQFQRLIGVVAGTLEQEHAKVEMDLCERLRKNNLQQNFNMTKGARYCAPLSSNFMGEEADPSFRSECKSLLAAGAGRDLDEMRWVAQQSGMKTNQSWVDQSLGGSLVPPAEFGDLIELLRNEAAMPALGARFIPLPPQGRITFPRQTSPSTAYNVGENSTITASNVGTGSLVLSAKKIGVLITMPNELIRFASPASEALLRSDMMKSASLKLDYDCLYGAGSDNVIQGLVNVPGTATVTPTTVGTDGNTLSPQDFYEFISKVEADNGKFGGYLMRPEMFWKAVETRATTYSGSGQVGQFVFTQFRALGDGFEKMLNGYKVVTTPQVSITRVKGSGSNLTTVFGGDWSNYMVALFGSIEFAAATQGDTAFANDQTVVRAIMTGDAAPRNPGVFSIADQLVLSIGN